MKQNIEKLIAALLVVSISLGSPVMSFAQTNATPASGAPSAKTTPVPVPPDPNEPWPRVMTYQGATISIFQPQVESWTGNQITGRSAVSVKSTKGIDYGVIWITARTEVDKINRMVTLLDLNITKQSFPTLPNNGSAYASALLKDLPWNKTVALDLLEADLAVTDAAAKQKSFRVAEHSADYLLQHAASGAGADRRQAGVAAHGRQFSEGGQHALADRLRSEKVQLLPGADGRLDGVADGGRAVDYLPSRAHERPGED